MRNLIGILSLCFLVFACEKEDVTILPVDGVALELHAIIICGNSFDLGNETPQEWGQRVVDAVTASGHTIISFELDFVEVEQHGFCGNCSATGDILKVVTTEADEVALRELGFVD